jgi:undecaprenyl-diphosphatase
VRSRIRFAFPFGLPCIFVIGEDYWVAFLAGVVQGIVEWLPISSQGNLALFLSLVGTSPDVALQLALFIQIGTTLSATIYYWDDIAAAFQTLPSWRPTTAFEGPNAITTFVVVASLATGVMGIPLFLFAVDAVSELAGGLFVALIGVLLIITGIVQKASEQVELGGRTEPTLLDAVIVGAFQGLTILPGVSRSGTTVSVLLFRSIEGAAALRLSFLLSIPASLAAGALTVLRSGGLPGVTPLGALIALSTAAVVGFATIHLLMRVVKRIPFWLVCFGLGGLAVGGGLLMYWAMQPAI